MKKIDRIPDIAGSYWVWVKSGAVESEVFKVDKDGNIWFAGGIIVGELDPSRLVATDGSSTLISTDLSGWISGTDNQIIITDDGDGTVTISLPNQVSLPTEGAGGGLVIGGDTTLYRFAANILKTDDIFDAWALQIGGVDVITSDRILANVTADADIITTGVFAEDRIPHVWGDGLGFSRPLATDWVLATLKQGEEEYRFLMDIAGRMEWGGGALARDVALYRDAANVLKTDDTFKALALFINGTEVITSACVLQNVTANASIINAGVFSEDRIPHTWTADLIFNRANATDDIIATFIVGDLHHRLIILMNGQIEWGPGDAIRDVKLYRDAANVLKTDDTFKCNNLFVNGNEVITAAMVLQNVTADAGIITSGTFAEARIPHTWVNDLIFNRANSTDDIIATFVAGDLHHRLIIYMDGKIEWGPGDALRDVTLYRGAANVLKTDDDLVIGGGNLYFGGAADTKFYRAGAGILKTDDHIVIAQNLYFGGGADIILYRGAADVLQTDDALKLNGVADLYFEPNAYSGWYSDIIVRQEPSAGAEALRIFTRGSNPFPDVERLTITSAIDTAEITIKNANLIIGGKTGFGKASLTLGAGATTFAVTRNVMEITGDGGGNTIATITGGISGQILVLIFVDANITITDDDGHGANTIDLSAAFTSADDKTLTLVFDGTSWYEVSRSTN